MTPDASDDNIELCVGTVKASDSGWTQDAQQRAEELEAALAGAAELKIVNGRRKCVGNRTDGTTRAGTQGVAFLAVFLKTRSPILYRIGTFSKLIVFPRHSVAHGLSAEGRSSLHSQCTGP